MLIEYNDRHHFGKNIRLLRKKHGLSRRALAQLLRIDVPFLKEMEEARSFPVIESAVLLRLYQIFDLPEDADLFSPGLFGY